MKWKWCDVRYALKMHVIETLTKMTETLTKSFAYIYILKLSNITYMQPKQIYSNFEKISHLKEDSKE